MEGSEAAAASARPSSCLTPRHVPQNATETSRPSVSGTSEPRIKARLPGWRRRVWTCKCPRLFYVCGLGGGGGLTCKSFHVSTGGATSYIRLDPFLSFVVFLFFTTPTERRPGAGRSRLLHLSRARFRSGSNYQSRVDLQTEATSSSDDNKSFSPSLGFNVGQIFTSINTEQSDSTEAHS